MNTKNIKFAGALLLGFLMITAVNAQNPRNGRGQGYNAAEKGYGQQFMRLDLTDEQQAEITTLRSEHYKEVTPLKNKMAELKARERTLLSEESVNLKAVNKTIDEQTDLTNTIRKLQVEQQVAVKSLLTDEQLMQLQQRRQFARRTEFHGKNGHRGNRATGMNRGYRGI